MITNTPLSGRTAIVTGGGGSIGTGISVRLVRDGANVVIAQRSAGSAAEVVERIKELGGNAAFVETDMNVEEDVDALVDATIERFGSADVVVNNAVNPRKAWAREMDRKLWEDVLKTNLTGPFRLAQKAYPHMAENGYGRVINIGAVQSQSPLPGAAAYATSKAGLEGLTRSLAAEWSSPNVTVNTVRVGPIFGSDWLVEGERPDDVSVEEEYESVPQEFDDEAATLVGRIGRPSDVAALVAFLARPESGFVTGAAIPCDGGRSLSRIPEPYDQKEDIE
jgi:NAD(P)-dependent dehydrogenase (short-subunit alcohol dehydrogenase family)